MADDKIPSETKEAKRSQLQNDVERQALRCAMAILCPVIARDEYADADVVKAVLKSIAAVRELTRAANKQVAQADPDGHMFFHEEVIVASALWAANARMDESDVQDIDPSCQGAVAYIGFAQAINLMEKVAQADALAWEIAAAELLFDSDSAASALVALEKQSEVGEQES